MKKGLCSRLDMNTPLQMWWRLRTEYRAWFCALVYAPCFVLWLCMFLWRFAVKAPE